jgi:hypothetical protein
MLSKIERRLGLSRKDGWADGLAIPPVIESASQVSSVSVSNASALPG